MASPEPLVGRIANRRGREATQDELCLDQLELWSAVFDEKWDEKEHGHFFGALHLSVDGGLDVEVMSRMIGPTRYLGAAFFVLIFGLNVRSIVMYLAESDQIHSCEVDLTRFFARQDSWIAQHRPRPSIVIAVFELLGVAWSVSMIFYHLSIVLWPDRCASRPFADARSKVLHPSLREDLAFARLTEFNRWHAVWFILKFDLPNLQTFSAMRLLQFVNPTIMYKNFFAMLKKGLRLHRSQPLIAVYVLGFMIGHILIFFFGFEAFVVKLSVVSTVLNDTEYEAHALITIAIFLNQMLGVVQLQVFINMRLFHFIFGGVDNFISETEMVRMHVWESGICLKAWRACKGHLFNFICLMLSFGDSDFQGLVLTEKNDMTTLPSEERY